MKNLLVFMVLFFYLSNCKHDNVKHNTTAVSEYIEIKHTGIEDKSMRPLIISTEKVCFEVNRSDVTFLDPKKPLTPEIKEAYLNVMYDFVITDTMTYQSIIDCVKTNPIFFTNDTNKNYDEYEIYSVAINGKTSNMFYKFQYPFFINLRRYLQMKNCDKSLINRLEKY